MEVTSDRGGVNSSVSQRAASFYGSLLCLPDGPQFLRCNSTLQSIPSGTGAGILHSFVGIDICRRKELTRSFLRISVSGATVHSGGNLHGRLSPANCRRAAARRNLRRRSSRLLHVLRVRVSNGGIALHHRFEFGIHYRFQCCIGAADSGALLGQTRNDVGLFWNARSGGRLVLSDRSLSRHRAFESRRRAHVFRGPLLCRAHHFSRLIRARTFCRGFEFASGAGLRGAGVAHSAGGSCDPLAGDAAGSWFRVFEWWFGLVVCRLFPTAFAFSLQLWAQQSPPPSHAAIIFTLEPV